LQRPGQITISGARLRGVRWVEAGVLGQI